MWCRRPRDEGDDVVEGALAAEVSLITLDMLDIITEVCVCLCVCVCLSVSVSVYVCHGPPSHTDRLFYCCLLCLSEVAPCVLSHVNILHVQCSSKEYVMM